MEPSKILRASTSLDVNICKIQKATNFTHFTPKIFHISPSKTVYIYTFAIVTMHIYMVTIAVYPIILLISHSAPFFLSLLHLQKQLKLLLSLIIFFFLWYTQTHPHRQANTETHKTQNPPSLTVSQNLQEHHYQNTDPTIHPTLSNHHHPTTTTITR